MTTPATDRAVHDLLRRASRAAQPILQVLHEQGEPVRVILRPEGLDLLMPARLLQGGTFTDAVEKQVRGLPINVYGVEEPCAQP